MSVSDDNAAIAAGKTHIQKHIEGVNPTGVRGKPVHTAEGMIRDRPTETPIDDTYLSPEFLKQAGMRPDEVPYWARDAAVWQKRNEIGDRQQAILHQIPGARIPTNANGQELNIRCGEDTRLMFIPTEHVEARQAEINRAAAEYQAQFEEEDGVLQTRAEYEKRGVERPRDPYRAPTRRDVEKQRQDYIKSGLIGETAGIPLAVAYQMFSKEQIENHENASRLGGRRKPQAFGDVLERSRAANADTSADRLFFGIGQTGLGQTTQEKVRGRLLRPAPQAQRQQATGRRA